jgi:hypothetical protein
VASTPETLFHLRVITVDGLRLVLTDFSPTAFQVFDYLSRHADLHAEHLPLKAICSPDIPHIRRNGLRCKLHANN